MFNKTMIGHNYARHGLEAIFLVVPTAKALIYSSQKHVLWVT